MKVRAWEYRPNRWKIEAWWKGQKVQKYSDKEGRVLKDSQEANLAAGEMYKEIKKGIFEPNEWAKEQPFILRNAFQTFQQTKQCEIEHREHRESDYLNHIAQVLCDMDIRKIQTVHVNQFHGTLIAKGLQNSTIQNILKLLRAIITYQGEGHKIKWPHVQVEQKAIRWFTEEQQEMVMAYLDEVDKPIFKFLQITGCRPSEACALQREDVNWEKQIVTIKRSMGKLRRIIEHTKTGDIRIIPMSVFSDLSILKPKEVTAFIFSKNGRPYHKTRLLRAWNKASIQANKEHGIPILPVRNAFRHSMASQLINKNIPLEMIAKMLGHSSVKITESTYANLLPETAWGYRNGVAELHHDRITDKKTSGKPLGE